LVADELLREAASEEAESVEHEQGRAVGLPWLGIATGVVLAGLIIGGAALLGRSTRGPERRVGAPAEQPMGGQPTLDLRPQAAMPVVAQSSAPAHPGPAHRVGTEGAGSDTATPQPAPRTTPPAPATDTAPSEPKSPGSLPAGGIPAARPEPQAPAHVPAAALSEAQAPAHAAPPAAASPDLTGMLRQARRLYRRGVTDKAADLANQVLGRDANADGAMVVLGNCKLDAGNLGEALRWADRALQSNAHNAEAYLLKGAVLQQRSQPKEARKLYQRYLELAPTGEYAADVRAILESL
jgi:hypothetical protein